jgi:opacity protein-like surface antigen
MKTKAILAASTALALIGTAQGAQAGDLYISVFGGANFQKDASGVVETSSAPLTVVEEWSTTADTGFVLGGAIGAHLDNWAKGLRVEVEASYRRNKHTGRFAEYDTTTTIDDGTTVITTEQGVINANLSTFAIMANAWYEFDIGTKFRPYVGGGMGWARTHGDMVAASTTTTSIDDSIDIHRSGFAWQLGVGLNYEVAPGVDLGMGYRYFQGPKFEPFFERDEQVNSLDNASHSVQVNLTVGID